MKWCEVTDGRLSPLLLTYQYDTHAWVWLMGHGKPADL